ncbi:hypothetical protein [Alicyclobacillus ferrooxydans]|uniref:hypothetical protein n=1 Tax=Alicyclobacillus ferrooxydans TaxID=471514 RepID=UPI0006D53DCF|nr:hypothetical protein [Alicyclobacillus ferrooxydans]
MEVEQRDEDLERALAGLNEDLQAELFQLVSDRTAMERPVSGTLCRIWITIRSVPAGETHLVREVLRNNIRERRVMR